jgi:hypothetical protein
LELTETEKLSLASMHIQEPKLVDITSAKEQEKDIYLIEISVTNSNLTMKVPIRGNKIYRHT